MFKNCGHGRIMVASAMVACVKSGSMRQVAFFSIIFLACTALYALRADRSKELLKAVVSIAIIAFASVATFGGARR